MLAVWWVTCTADSPSAIRHETDGGRYAYAGLLLADCRFAPNPPYALNDLFDIDGSAVIIHADPDNYANIPSDRYSPAPDATTLATGDAGARVACGIIKPSNSN